MPGDADITIEQSVTSSDPGEKDRHEQTRVDRLIVHLSNATAWFAVSVGFVYAITTQSHVRVDILHSGFSRKKQARTEVFGLGWLLLPFLAMMCDILTHYGWASVLVREGSDSPNGLHHLYLLKMSMPVIFFLAILATVSMVTRHLAHIAPGLVYSRTFLLLRFMVVASTDKKRT